TPLPTSDRLASSFPSTPVLLKATISACCFKAFTDCLLETFLQFWLPVSFRQQVTGFLQSKRYRGPARREASRLLGAFSALSPWTVARGSFILVQWPLAGPFLAHTKSRPEKEKSRQALCGPERNCPVSVALFIHACMTNSKNSAVWGIRARGSHVGAKY